MNEATSDFSAAFLSTAFYHSLIAKMKPTQQPIRIAVRVKEIIDLMILVPVETPMFSQYISDGSGALSKMNLQLFGRQQPGKKVLEINFTIGH